MAAPPGPPRPRRRFIGRRSCHLDEGAGTSRLPGLAPLLPARSRLAALGVRGGASRQCAAPFGRRREAAGRSHLQSGKEAGMTPRAAILIGGRAWQTWRWAPSWVRAGGSPACTLCGPGLGRHVGGGQGGHVPPPSRVRGAACAHLWVSPSARGLLKVQDTVCVTAVNVLRIKVTREGERSCEVRR